MNFKFLLEMSPSKIFLTLMGLLFIPGMLYLLNVYTYTVFKILSMLDGALFFIWLYTVGDYLFQKLPKGISMNINLFKVAITLSLFLLLFWSIYHNLISILALTLIAAYSTYFVSRSICTIEKNRKVDFSEYAGTFISIWIFPLGIWFIQPRVQKIIFANDERKV